MPPKNPVSSFAHGAANTELLQRLRSANGHLRAVIAMAEAGAACEPVLHQLCAVQAALMAARRALIQRQVAQITDSILNDAPLETQAQTVAQLSNLYSLFIKSESVR